MRNEQPEQKQVALSEQEGAIVEELEQLPIASGDLMDLLLVWRGLKQATNFSLTLHEWYNREDIVGPFTAEEQRYLEKKIEVLFHRMGLHRIKDQRSPIRSIHSYGDEEKGEPEELGGSLDLLFYVSRDPKKAKRLSEIWLSFTGDHAQELRIYKELGELFGFPATAVDAYGKFRSIGYNRRREVSMDKEDLPADIRKQDFMAFAQFRLSKGHWREELETAKRWAEEIKRTDPALYIKRGGFLPRFSHDKSRFGIVFACHQAFFLLKLR